jgi:hypothetical protein
VEKESARIPKSLRQSAIYHIFLGKVKDSLKLPPKKLPKNHKNNALITLRQAKTAFSALPGEPKIILEV